MERVRVIRNIDGQPVTYTTDGWSLEALEIVERNKPGKLLALLRVHEPGDGIHVGAAIERRTVELPDGRSARLFAIPNEGDTARVKLPGGGVLNVPCRALRLVDVLEVSP